MISLSKTNNGEVNDVASFDSPSMMIPAGFKRVLTHIFGSNHDFHISAAVTTTSELEEIHTSEQTKKKMMMRKDCEDNVMGNMTNSTYRAVIFYVEMTEFFGELVK